MSFSKEVGDFITKAKFKTDEEFGRAVLALHNDIVTGTPVRDGILQNNWQIGANAPRATKYTGKPGKDTSGAMARGEKWAKGLTIKDTAIIFNNMEYAEVVENSVEHGRIPAKMVALAILQAQARNSI